MVGFGIVTGNPTIVIWGLGGFAGGKFIENKLKNRRE